MKWLNYYKDKNLTSDDKVFEHLTTTLRPNVSNWNYFVDWEKVFTNTRQAEVLLNTANYLLGKSDFAGEFRRLVKTNPEVLRVIPILIVRNGDHSTKFNVVTVDGINLIEEAFEFNKPNPSEQDIEDAIIFIEKSGLIRIFAKDGIKNLVDYAFGVEAGLSTNGRKNRGGKSMEAISRALLNNLHIDFIEQATVKRVQEKFGVTLKNSVGRKFDFVFMAQNGLNVIEANCYSSGGSKLDKTASDFKTLQNDLRGQATFIWFTDGHGWLKSLHPLRKAFDSNDYILNIQMIKNGALEEILNNPR